jgi:hypothetical protein
MFINKNVVIILFFARRLFTAVLMSSMIPLTILSLDTDETVRNLSIELILKVYM